MFYVTAYRTYISLNKIVANFGAKLACLSTLSAFARPNHWPNLSLLMSEIYTKYVQGPYAGQDVTANQYGLTKSDALDWLHSNGIGYYDLQSIVDTGDMDLLKHHMGAMNECGIPVMLGINDESHIYQAKLQADGSYVQGTKTHSWADTGLKHCIIRVGMRLDAPVTLINDPATACPPFAYPTPILWDDLKACGINTAIGVMSSWRTCAGCLIPVLQQRRQERVACTSREARHHATD